MPLNLPMASSPAYAAALPLCSSSSICVITPAGSMAQIPNCGRPAGSALLLGFGPHQEANYVEFKAARLRALQHWGPLLAAAWLAAVSQSKTASDLLCMAVNATPAVAAQLISLKPGTSEALNCACGVAQAALLLLSAEEATSTSGGPRSSCNQIYKVVVLYGLNSLLYQMRTSHLVAVSSASLLSGLYYGYGLGLIGTLWPYLSARASVFSVGLALDYQHRCAFVQSDSKASSTSGTLDRSSEPIRDDTLSPKELSAFLSDAAENAAAANASADRSKSLCQYLASIFGSSSSLVTVASSLFGVGPDDEEVGKLCDSISGPAGSDWTMQDVPLPGVITVHLYLPAGDPGQLQPSALGHLRSQLHASLPRTAVVGACVRKGSLMVALDVASSISSEASAEETGSSSIGNGSARANSRSAAAETAEALRSMPASRWLQWMGLQESMEIKVQVLTRQETSPPACSLRGLPALALLPGPAAGSGSRILTLECLGEDGRLASGSSLRARLNAGSVPLTVVSEPGSSSLKLLLDFTSAQLPPFGGLVVLEEWSEESKVVLASVPVLVLPDTLSTLAAELAGTPVLGGLEGSYNPAGGSVVTTLGWWLGLTNQMDGVSAEDIDSGRLGVSRAHWEQQRVFARKAGIQLIRLAVQNGKLATARLVLSRLRAPGCGATRLAELASGSGHPAQHTLLHLAVLSCSRRMLEELLAWPALLQEPTWRWDEEDEEGLTPLHLAALMGKAGESTVRNVLLKCAEARAAWTAATTWRTRCTPAQLLLRATDVCRTRGGTAGQSARTATAPSSTPSSAPSSAPPPDLHAASAPASPVSVTATATSPNPTRSPVPRNVLLSSGSASHTAASASAPRLDAALPVPSPSESVPSHNNPVGLPPQSGLATFSWDSLVTGFSNSAMERSYQAFAAERSATVAKRLCPFWILMIVVFASHALYSNSIVECCVHLGLIVAYVIGPWAAAARSPKWLGAMWYLIYLYRSLNLLFWAWELMPCFSICKAMRKGGDSVFFLFVEVLLGLYQQADLTAALASRATVSYACAVLFQAVGVPWPVQQGIGLFCVTGGIAVVVDARRRAAFAHASVMALAKKVA